MKKLKKLLLWIHQLPQNIIGFILSRNSECKVYTTIGGDNVIVYFNNRVFNCGVSLGNYIILDTENYMNDSYNTRITVSHEHGHQIQSLHLGWLYLLLIGIPSAIGNIIDRVFHKKWSSVARTKWYYNQIWEKSADNYGGVIRHYV